jgi:hypothetical protein
MAVERPGVDRRGDRLFIAMTAGTMAVFAVTNSLSVQDDYRRHGERIPYWEPLLWEASSIAVWLALLPLILAATRRAWPLAPPWWWMLGVHFMILICVSLAHVVGMGVVRWATYSLFGRTYSAANPLGQFLYEFRKDALVYAALVVLYSGWRLLRTRSARPPPPDSGSTLEVRDGARRHFVPLNEIDLIEAAGNYVELQNGGAPILHRAALSELARSLEMKGFVRIHRSRLVRQAAVARVDSKPSGDFVVTLQNGRTLAGSRRYRRPLLDR